MKYIITSIYTVLILISCSSDTPSDENGQSNTVDPIFPSNLTLNISIVGQSSDFPNGDGSGDIICFASAGDAINYEFRFGAGNVIESPNGQVQFSYSEPGLQSRTVYVYAYSVTDDYVSTSTSFDLYVDDQDQSTATWSEEFNYTGSINGNIWTAEIGNGNNGWGNGESQFYTADPENVRVEDGLLKITAKRENLAGYNFTSSRIISKDKYEFKYGRVDIRAKLPTGVGTWPALWMLGANYSEVGWPECGEIDIMEHWGHDPTVIAGSIHTPMSHGDTWTDGHTIVNDYDQEFHIYSIDWNQNRIQFFVDDVLYYTYNPSPKNDENWPFDQDAFFIINVAMGGHWFDIDPNFVESTMEVDYIRVYQ